MPIEFKALCVIAVLGIIAITAYGYLTHPDRKSGDRP
jgi:hypothetical protein